MAHLTAAEFEEKLPWILDAPRNKGVLKMIVIRPGKNERTILKTCELSAAQGTHGDIWAWDCWKSLPDGSPHPDVQIALTSSRVMEAIEADHDRRALAGDNLYVDLDLSQANLAPGDRLSVGSAVLQITDTPHNGCRKFRERFGVDALKAIDSESGKANRLRGVYARVTQDGVVTVGDVVTKVRRA